MKQRKCLSCGAPIEVGATKCEYCGMVYEPDYWNGTIKYVPYHAGRKRLRVRSKIPDELLDTNVDKETLARYVKSDLSRCLADALSEFMTIRISKDYASMINGVTIVEGEIWVEEPDHRTAFSVWDNR